MKRKDCDNRHKRGIAAGRGRVSRPPGLSTVIVLIVMVLPSVAWAESIRLWPTAVVVGESVRVSDVCELRGFDVASERRIADLIVASAPAQGESRTVELSALRSILRAGGVNFASATLSGATKCSILRPSAIGRVQRRSRDRVVHDPLRINTEGGDAARQTPSATLRQAVVDHFDKLFARYRGKADVVFDRHSQKVLDLSGPAYEFRVRQRAKNPLGLVQMTVDVLAEGQVVQTISLVTQVSMTRLAVVARRSINQGATIRTQEVELVPLTFTRLDKLGMSEIVSVIGQRSKRFIPAGSMLEPEVLESVPLVTRGQLVTLVSEAGAVRIVTTGKALQSGLLGQSISVRALDNKRVDLDAVVIGPGEVRIGSATPANRMVSVMAGGTP